MGVCQQLLHDEIIVDLFGKFSPLFRAFELLVRLDLQCINEKFLMELEMAMRATTLLANLNSFLCGQTRTSS